MLYTHGMIIGSRVWIKEMKYRSWRIYLIFRALANNTQSPIKARSKTLKSFCQTTFYHDLLAYVWHENQGVTDLPPLQESRHRDSQTRRGKEYGN